VAILPISGKRETGGSNSRKDLTGPRSTTDVQRAQHREKKKAQTGHPSLPVNGGESEKVGLLQNATKGGEVKPFNVGAGQVGGGGGCQQSAGGAKGETESYQCECREKFPSQRKCPMGKKNHGKYGLNWGKKRGM